MDERDKAIADAEAAFGELRHAIAGLHDDGMRQVWLGTWGVREILIHTAAWHRVTIAALPRLVRGEAPHPEGVSYDDFDAWNARFVAERAGVKSGEVLAELEASHRDLLEAARRVPVSAFAPGTPARKMFDGNGPEHYREHAEQIRGWREKAVA